MSAIVSIRRGRPPSPMQRSLYVSQRRSPDAPVQNMALLTHVDGPLDAGRLVAAFDRVVASAAVLRSRFVDGPGGVEVRADASVTTEIIDLERDQAVSWAEARVARPLDPARCCVDSVVLRHEDGTASWFLDLHHTVTDATAASLVFAATAAVYQGDEPPITPYADVVDQLATPDRTPWADRSPAPTLGRLYGPKRSGATRAERVRVLADADLGARAEQLDPTLRLLTEELTWTALLATAAAVHVHVVTRADRFAIGIPIHNRRTPAQRSTLGPLMEVFPLDVEIRADDTHGDLHRRVARGLLDLLRTAKPGTAPTADHEIVVNVIPKTGFGPFAGIPATTHWVHTGTIDAGQLARVQLTGYGEQGRELVVDLDESALGPPTGTASATNTAGTRAAGHFRTALDTLLDAPSTPLASTVLHDAAEADAIDRWGDGGPAPAPRDLVEWLGAALGGRDEVVVECDGEPSWTGRELWARAGAVAATLAERGVEPGDRVALSVERSPAAVALVLGCLRRGASFVPLDPEQPAARRQLLADRAGVALVVTDTEAASLVDSAPPVATDSPGLDPVVEADRDPDREAYCLFTSGSTGEPKGVPITVSGLARYLAHAVANYGDAPVVPLFGALTFDLTVTSVFLPLLAGGRCTVVRGDNRQAIAALAKRRDLTWLKATPSHLELLLRLDPEVFSGVRTIVVGGEAFRRDLADRIHAAAPDARVLNEYGPTEAVVGCMLHDDRPDAHPAEAGADVPIGRPIEGVDLKIVGPGLTPVPLGAAGELLIAGPGLTPGYLPPVDLDPFVEIDGRRWYRTGDLVRLATPETAVYLGRIDAQLKVGGIRLDPSEVEAALAAHSGVESATVRMWSPTVRRPRRHCVWCGLPDTVPDVGFDDDGVCDTCRAHERVEPVTRSWFGTELDLIARRDAARAARTGDYDCLHLLSGGKDSTYALYRLVDLGWRPYVLTLDNGFISEQSKQNVARTIEHLGLDHEFATSEAMPAIFRDSLERHSNVCQGCYKTIYTLATSRAVELGIPVVVTGLSRGQLFETRLIPQQFQLDRFDPDAIDRAVIEARRAYHRVDDAARRLLDTTVFDGPLADGRDVFETVDYLDLYRYLDVPLAEMLDYLDTNAPWVRPTDTGRSTNCRINDIGIHTHLLEQGFHNYAIPYAWDVRLGHKTRDEAMEELDDRLDPDDVAEMLTAVGYEPRRREVLTAWFVPADGGDLDPAELRAHLAGLLPSHAIPAAFVAVDAVPTGSSGKVDTASLPAPRLVHRRHDLVAVRAPEPHEAVVIEVAERVLRVEPIGVDDDFFALGGDSLAALELVVALGDQLGRTLPEDLPFTHPTPATLAAAIDQLAPATSEPPADDPGTSIDASTAASTARSTAEARRTGPPALTPGQEAMWFEHRLDPDAARYNVAHHHRLAAGLDLERLENACSRAVAAHPELAWTPSVPRHRVDPDEAVSFTVLDSDRIDPVAADLHHHRPFDLSSPPLVRIVACSTGTATEVLVVVHHTTADAAGLRRLWHDIERAYAGRTLDEPRRSLAAAAAPGDEAAADLDHWRRLPAPDATWRLERPDAAVADGMIRRTIGVSPDQLRAAGRPRGDETEAVGGADLCLAAFGRTLWDRCDGETATVGMLTSLRRRPEDHDLVAFLLGTTPVQIPRPTAGRRDHLTAVAALARAARRHRSTPLAEIVATRRADGLAPLATDVLFAFDRLEDESPEDRQGDGDRDGAFGTDDLEVRFNGEAVARLTGFVEVRADRIDLAVEHRGTDVSAADAEAFLDDWEAAITDLCGQSSAEPGPRHPSVAVGPSLSSTGDVVATILRRLDGRPDAPAVRCGDESWDNATLDRASRRVAAELAADGVGRGDRVAIHLERSPWLIAAIVGVLRIGAAYVPIDPTAPLARRRLVLDAADAVAVIADDDHDLDGARVVRLGRLSVDGDAPGPAADGTAAPDVVGAPDDPAYVIFTSGTTGTPSAVTIDRGQLDRSTAARPQFYGDDPTSFLVVSSAAFDSSVAGLFWTLTSGGELVVPTDAEVHDADALASLLASGTISHTLMVPTLYQAVVQRAARIAGPSGWPSTVVVAGEGCPPSLVDLHRRRHPDTRLVNEYGPTEAAVWCTAHELVPGDGSTTVAIGGPIPGASIAVVDRHGRPRPEGVAGELVVGGDNLAAGYDGDPERTADRFVDGPLGRVFRTGDLAVMRDGVATHLGRIDHQLSLGGVRVEPEEIEAVLLDDPAVDHAVVHLADLRPLDRLLADASTEQQRTAMASAAAADDPTAALRQALAALVPTLPSLVARVVPADGATIDVDRLRTALSVSLPADRRPSVIAVEAQLPRNANGKLDRDASAALPLSTDATPRPATPPAPGHDDGSIAAADRAAATDVIAATMGRALDRAPLGPDDDFFDAGGHSLLALVVVDDLAERAGLPVTVRDLYRHRTPARLADTLDPGEVGTASTNDEHYLLELRPGGDDIPLVGVHVLGENGAFYRPLADRLPEGHPVLGLGLAGRAPTADTPHEARDVARRYADELEAHRPGGGPVVLAAVSMGAFAALELADELRHRGRLVPTVILFDGLGPDPVTGRLEPRERVRLHATQLAADPRRYVSQRVEKRTAVMRRRVELLELRMRERAAFPIPDRLRSRAFVEQNLASTTQRAVAPYPGRLVVFKAADDPFLGHLAAEGMGWHRTARGTLHIEVVDGGHLSMLDTPFVDALAVRVGAELERARGWRDDEDLVHHDLGHALAEGRLDAALVRWRGLLDLPSGAGGAGPTGGSLASRLLDAVASSSDAVARRIDEVRGDAERLLSADALRWVPGAARPTFAVAHARVADGGASRNALLDRLTEAGWSKAAGGGADDFFDVITPDGDARLRLLATPADRAGQDNRADGVSAERSLGVYVATPDDLIDPLLDLLDLGPDGHIADIGCGDGRVLVAAARRGWRATGIEIDDSLARRARQAADEQGVADRVTVHIGDLRDDEAAPWLEGPSAVFAFLPAEVVAELLPTLLATVPPGARVLTHEQLAADWPVRPTGRRVVAAGAGLTTATWWTAPGRP